jgi:hypothetical protein
VALAVALDGSLGEPKHSGMKSHGYMKRRVRIRWRMASREQLQTRSLGSMALDANNERIPLDSGLIFSFAGSVLVCGREQLLR